MKAGTAKPKPNVYNQPIAMRYIYMSNLTPDDVDIRLTETREEFSEEHTRLWEGLEDEKVSRIAGDEANKQFTQQVQDENQGTESRLSTEVIHRSEGDLSNVNSITALAQALADYRIKTDLELANEALVREQLGIDLNTRMDNVVASFDHEKFLIYKTISEVQTDVNNKYTSMDLRIKKYEEMLQDITTDSIQITMDNGEINMGAWTILSQAREWDLEILAKFKDYKTQTDKDINDALEDLQNKLPVEQDIIDKAIEALSNAPIIKELDEKLTSNIDSIYEVKKDLLQETTDRTNEIIGLAQANANALTKQAKELTDKLELEARERIDSIQKESEIRQQQLLDEATDRTKEIDERIKDIEGGLDVDLTEVHKRIDDANAYAEQVKADLLLEEQARIENIKTLNDGLTAEIQHRKDGDASTLTALENYKVSNDAALANVRDELTINVSNTTANAEKISALDVRLKTNEDLAASAVSKAETALSENVAQATQINQVKASIESINGELGNKADAQALQVLDSKVTTIDGKVTAQSTQLTQLTARVDVTEGEIKKKLDASVIEKYSTTVDMNKAITEQTTAAVSGIVVGANNLITLGDGTLRVGSGSIVPTRTVIDGDIHFTGTGTTFTSFNAWYATGTDFSDVVNLNVGEEFTVTLFFKPEDSVNLPTITLMDFYMGYGYGYKGMTQNVPFSSSKGEVMLSTTFTKTAKAISPNPHINAKVVLNGGLILTRWKVEKGNKATDWSDNARNVAKTLEANSEAIKSTTTAVQDLDGKITSAAGDLTALTARVATTENEVKKKADAQAVQNLTTRVETAEGQISSQGTAITKLTNDLATTNANVNKKADAAALTALDSKVTSIDGLVTSQGTALTKLTNDLATVDAAVKTKAESSALTALDSKVTEINGKVTSQGASITQLNNTIDNMKIGGTNLQTNSHFDANKLNGWIAPYGTTTVANSKLTATITSVNAASRIEKVIPAKLLEDNTEYVLSIYATTSMMFEWRGFLNAELVRVINPTSFSNTVFQRYSVVFKNTNSGNNTTIHAYVPNIPTGSTIVVEWEKLEKGNVPTDWSSAASEQASAEAMQQLSTKVEAVEGNVTSQGAAITALANRVTTAEGDIKKKADSSYVQTIDNKVGVIEGKVTSNTADIVTIKNSVSQVEKDVALKADAKALETLSNQVTINKDDIKSNSAKLVSLDNSISQVTNAVYINGGSSLTKDLEFNRPITVGEVDYVVSKDAANTRYIKLGNNSGNDVVWLHSKRMLQFDPKRMYKVRCRFCLTEIPAGTTSFPGFYIGFAAKNSDMTSYITSGGGVSDNMGSSTYLLVASTPTVGTWYEYTYYVTGRSAGAASGGGTLEIPKNVQVNAAYIAPMFIANYPSKAGTVLLDYLYMEVADQAKTLDANAKAIESLTSDVSTVKGEVSSLSNKTTLLENRVTTAENGLTKKADAAALQLLDSRVETAEGKITSQGSSVTKLENRFNSHSVNSINQLANSNIVGTYDGKYPHLVYTLGEGFVSGAVYTLIYCAEHKRGPSDTNSYLAAYAAGGQQTVAVFPVNGAKNVYSVTFTKNAQLEAPKQLRFYVINKPSTATVATVYWAVLLKGNTEVVDTWIPSPYDYLADTTAISTAVETLDNKVVAIDGKVTTANNKITLLEGRVQTTEDGLKKKADVTALEGLQTEAQVNSAIASKLTQLTASLYSGTDNLLLNSSLEVATGWYSNGGNLTLHTRAANPSFVFPNTNKQSACWKLVSTAPMQGRYSNPQSISFELNEELVGSIWLKGEVGGEKIIIMSEGIKYETSGLNVFTLTTEWKRYWVTGRRAAKGAFNFTIYTNNPAGTTQTVYLSQVQLERGNIPSDWKEASTTTTGLMNATATTLSETKAMVSEHDGKITTNTSDLTNLKGRMEVAESGIVTQTEATRLLTGRVEKTEKGVDANTKALTQVNTTISNLEVGGTNLLSRSNLELGTVAESYAAGTDWSVIKIAASGGNRFRTKNLIPITLPTSISIVSDYEYCVVFLDANAKYLGISRFITWSSKTNVITAPANAAFIGLAFRKPSNAVVSSADFELLKCKVEKGNLPSTWSPAPEDVASANALSLLDTRVVKTEEGIKTTADALTKVETKVALTKKYIVSTHKNGYTSGPAAGLMDETGETRLAPLYRGLNLIVFEADGSFKSFTGYDTYATLANAQTLATAINALPSKTYFIVAGLDNVGSLSASGTIASVIALKDAIIASGGTEAYFNTWTGNSMPIFVGRKGAGGGMGIQNLFNSGITNDWIRVPIVFQAGTPEGFGGAPVIDTTQFASASAFNNLSTKVGEIDGKVTTHAETITQLEANVGANSAKLLVQGTAIDGLSASYVVKTDVNGLVVSYGLYNKDGVGAFGVNADYFYVGKGTTATNGKKPFMVLTSAQTIGGVTYPAGTWIDVALIANATIGTAKIADLAVTTAKIANLAVDNAKIANLSAEKITAGTINAARIGAKSITADKLYSDTVSGMFANFGTFTTTNTKGSTTMSGPLMEVKYPNGVTAVKLGVW